MKTNCQCFTRSMIAALSLFAIAGSWLATPASAAIKWGYTEIPSANLTLLLILDDASQKVFMQVSGPADRWFAWGFGSQVMPNTPATVFNVGTQGNFYEVFMSNYVQPQNVTALGSSQFSFGTSCVSNGVSYFFLERPLAGDSVHYNFSTQQTNVSLIWARGGSYAFSMEQAKGATSLNPTNAPPPQFTKAVLGVGAATLSITNVIVSVTNQLQFSADLNASSWTTLTNLVIQPPCGANALTQFITVNVPRTNSSAGFWRIKQ